MFSTCTSSTRVNHAARNACAPVPAQQRSLLEPHGCTMPYRAEQAPDASSWLQPRADSYFNRLVLHLDVSPLDFASQVVPGRPHQKCVSLSGIAPKAQIRVVRFLRQRQ